jgi:hypothetical protein
MLGIKPSIAGITDSAGQSRNYRFIGSFNDADARHMASAIMVCSP